MKRFLLFSFLFCTISLAFSGNENLPVGARSAAIGNASVCLVDVWSVYHNQANLAYHKNISAAVYYENKFLVKEMSLQSAAFVLPTKKLGTFALSYSGFGYSLYRESKYNLSYSMNFGPNFSAGVGMNYLNTYISENYGRRNAFTVELGLRATVLKKLVVGFHAYNLTRAKMANYNNERIPTILRLGLQYNFSEKIFLSTEVEKDIDYKPVFKAGMEYRPAKLFYIRAGISTNPFISSFGIGFNISGKFNIDLASTVHPVLGLSPMASLSYNFK
ncbi:MAG: hypothetical protein POELPBGB_01976 [Bacteroidia bacterium]|nr:hypothetical protein [Bacteroidia bacterium]